MLKKCVLLMVMVMVLGACQVSAKGVTISEQHEVYTVQGIENQSFYLEEDIQSLAIVDSSNVSIYGFNGQSITITGSDNIHLNGVMIDTDDIAITCTDSTYITFVNLHVANASMVFQFQDTDYVSITDYVSVDTSIQMASTNLEMNIEMLNADTIPTLVAIAK